MTFPMSSERQNIESDKQILVDNNVMIYRPTKFPASRGGIPHFGDADYQRIFVNPHANFVYTKFSSLAIAIWSIFKNFKLIIH